MVHTSYMNKKMNINLIDKTTLFCMFSVLIGLLSIGLVVFIVHKMKLNFIQ